MPLLHSGAATDRPEATHLTFPPAPEVVWQQPQETYLNNIHNDLTNETHKHTHTPIQKNDVEAQTSPIKETSSQEPGSNTEPLLETQNGAYQYSAPMTPTNNKPKSNEMK